MLLKKTISHTTGLFVLAAALLMLVACGSSSDRGSSTPPQPSGQVSLKLETVAGGFSFPLYITAPPGDARLFVVEKGGQIKIIQNGTTLPAPFLDLSSRISDSGERGLLSMAFSPQFANNRQFFVYYTNTTGNIVVERYTASSTVANQADPASAVLVMTINHPTYDNHNGGQLAFGTDGYLYIGTGDGGGGDDPFKNGQNTGTMQAKILRIDVSSLPYKIPPSNPFAVATGKAREIWAYGLRNPWRFSFDAPSAKLYISDVGQDAREEINVADAGAAGLNYGWSVTEGNLCLNGTACDKSGITMPAVEQNHPDSESITGGYVYRGNKIPELRGTYFYGDFIFGWVKSFVFANGVATDQKDWPSLMVENLASFGVDSAGELYAVSLCGGANCDGPGTVYRIVRQ
ncbi:MAG: PQQ-dependent sugar dehydrogenase [Burkholderiales bacterium]